jgi:filamin
LFPVNKTTHLELTSNDLANNDINIKLTNPSGHQLTVTRSVTPQNTLKISFVPTEIGTHLLHVDVASVGIYGSPFEIKVYDSARILVSDVRGSDVNKPCELTIDASSAGEGQLEIAVNDGSIKNTVKQIKIGHYVVSFLPNKQDTYVIDVRFNQECVPGCPKKVFVKDVNSAKVTGVLMENVLVGISQSFQVDGIYNLADLSARIVAPSEQEFVPKIIQTSSTECRIEWQPYELGTYLVQVTYCDRLVKGTPFKVKTYDPKRVVVYNLKDGLAFKPNTFCVDAGQAGEGSLEIGISCNGHYIPNQVKPLGNSKFEVHFLPQEATVHYANISFNNDSVKGSPFAIKVFDTNLVTAQGKGLGLIPINLPTSFQVFSGNAGGGGQVRALVTGSKGENVSVKIYEQPNGDSVGEFVPLSIGQYRIEILYANQPVVGSPFFANAYDPQALEIVNMPKDLIAGSENFLEVNLSRVGNVDFDIKVVAPSGNVLPVTFEGQAYIKKIRLVPIELGAHRISLMLAGQQINGMPITLNAIDSRLPNARGDGLNHALEDRQASFCVESQGLQGNLDVKIEGPQQYTKNQIERQSDGSYLVKYTPVEVGQFKIFVKWNNRDVPGSPFLSYVVNPDKVRIVGGWQSILDFKNVLNLKLFEEKVINFETSEAGPGTLNASILSPNGTKLPLRLASQGQMYSLIFTALYEGEYKIYLSWDNYQIPNTPIIAKTTPQSDITKIEITGLGLSEAKINQESDFVIDGSRAGEMPGIPEIRLSGTRCDIDVRVLQLGHGIYRCSYVPQIPGAYLLNIKWNNIQIGESPYKVNVSMNSDPAKVVVSGEGIKSGVYGQEIKALIDTRRAGPGELTAHCMGPTKVAFCEFFDHKDGTFTLYVKPQEPGKHLLQVKYNDDHVPGSPYIIRIAGPPDAGKVKVLGPGICHGVLNKFKSRFICETKGAGAGQLTVRIRGPKGK